MAALWPGMPLTPPPRRAPGAAQQDRGIVGLDAPPAGVLGLLGERPAEVAVEDVPRGQAQLALEVERRADLDARRPVGRAQDAVLDRLGEHAVERAQRRRERRVARAVVVAGEQPRRHVQAEQRQRLRAARAQVGPEDARVGQRVAVDLARRQVGDRPGARLEVRALELRRGLVDVEGPGERLLGRDRAVAQTRQAAQQQVDLQLRALRRDRARRRRPAAQAVELGGRRVDEHVPRADRRLAALGVGHADLPRSDRGDLGVRAQLRARGERRVAQRADTAPMPPTGTSQSPVPAADHVVQKAAVLAQVGVVRSGERADERVGERHAAHEVVAERRVEQLAQRRLDQRVPERVVAGHAPQLVAGAQRLGERREQPLGHPPDAVAEVAPGLEVAGPPVTRANDAAVALASPPSTSSPCAPPARGSGV
jgi:hypothetical protein